MIALHFPKLSGYVRTGEICTIATPHAQGALKCAQDACVFDSSGPVPSQSRATALSAARSSCSGTPGSTAALCCGCSPR